MEDLFRELDESRYSDTKDIGILCRVTSGRSYGLRIEKPSFVREMRLLKADKEQEDAGDKSFSLLKIQGQSPEKWPTP